MVYNGKEVGVDLDMSNRMNFLSPTSTLYIFTTLPYDKLYVTFENNVKLPIEHVSHYGDKPGVYIIKSYDVPYNAHDTQPLVNYNNNNVRDNILKNNLNGIFTNGGLGNSNTHTEVFIPEEDLINYGSVLVSQYKLLISYNDVNSVYIENDDINLDVDDFKIVIYDSRSPGRKYYIKILGIIKEITTKKGNRKDGIYLFTKLGTASRKKVYPLCDMESLGIYKYRHEAVNDGYIKDRIELYKQEQELRVLKAGYESKIELLRLGVIKGEAEADIKISLARQQQNIADRKMSIENSRLDRSNIKDGISLGSDLLTIAGKFL